MMSTVISPCPTGILYTSSMHLREGKECNVMVVEKRCASEGGCENRYFRLMCQCQTYQVYLIEYGNPDKCRVEWCA